MHFINSVTIVTYTIDLTYFQGKKTLHLLFKSFLEINLTEAYIYPYNFCTVFFQIKIYNQVQTFFTSRHADFSQPVLTFFAFFTYYDCYIFESYGKYEV